MQAAMESCAGKSVLSGVMGFGMGGLFGMFMASVRSLSVPLPKLSSPPPHHHPLTFVLARSQMSYDTPFSGNPTAPTLSTREQIRLGFRDMGSRSWSTAKNFGRIGALFSGIECGFEGLRAKHDLANGAAAGCLTGAILARNSGPQAMAGGCAAFAAFSTAIEMWMMQPKDE